MSEDNLKVEQLDDKEVKKEASKNSCKCTYDECKSIVSKIVLILIIFMIVMVSIIYVVAKLTPTTSVQSDVDYEDNEIVIMDDLTQDTSTEDEVNQGNLVEEVSENTVVE